MSVTFDKFATDELVESWWKTLRTCSYPDLERRIDSFISRATDTTKFPRPGQFRPDDQPAPMDSKDAAREARITEDGIRSWNAFLAKNPTTGQIRFKLAQAARIMASTREDNPAYAEAEYEYRALEKQLGEHGRFARDA